MPGLFKLVLTPTTATDVTDTALMNLDNRMRCYHQDFSKGFGIEMDVSTYGQVKATPQKLDLSSFALPGKPGLDAKLSCQKVTQKMQDMMLMQPSMATGLQLLGAVLALFWV